MAIIQTVNDLYNRIRTILDKGGSAWMSDDEIGDFISMAANEFTQERVDKFGATQRIRDDLGSFVRTLIFFDSHNTSLQNTVASLYYNSELSGESPIFWLGPAGINLNFDFGFEIWPISYHANPISPVSCDMLFNGIYYDDTNTEGGNQIEIADEFKPLVNTIVSCKLVNTRLDESLSDGSQYFKVISQENIKIISIDDWHGSMNDPFNKPDEDNRVAIRTGSHYNILPDVNLYDVNNTSQGFIVFDYVSGSCTNENIVKYMPKSSVEEICQIAARKILGTIADERYQIGDAEINQLNR